MKYKLTTILFLIGFFTASQFSFALLKTSETKLDSVGIPEHPSSLTINKTSFESDGSPITIQINSDISIDDVRKRDVFRYVYTLHVGGQDSRTFYSRFYRGKDAVKSMSNELIRDQHYFTFLIPEPEIGLLTVTLWVSVEVIKGNLPETYCQQSNLIVMN